VTTVADLVAARAASRQYRMEASRLRREAEEAVAAGKPRHAKALRFYADMVAHAAEVEVRDATR